MSLIQPSGSPEYHLQELLKHCRICGRRFSRSARKHSKNCNDTIQLIKRNYDTNVQDESADTYPPDLCHACFNKMKRTTKAEDTHYHSPSTLFQWSVHIASSCSICDHFQQTSLGGRPKKRQCSEPADRLHKALQDNAGPALVSGITWSQLLQPAHISKAHVLCALCHSVADSPLQLSCDRLVCHSCLQQHVTDGEQNCPGCQEMLDTVHVSKCTALVLATIAHLHVQCKFGCPFPITLKELRSHESTCGQHEFTRGSLTDMTLGEVMNIPLTVPLSADEEAVCSRLVRRSTTDGKLVITTGGQVSIYTHAYARITAHH